jgi:hypothetical protein
VLLNAAGHVHEGGALTHGDLIERIRKGDKPGIVEKVLSRIKRSDSESGIH